MPPSQDTPSGSPRSGWSSLWIFALTGTVLLGAVVVLTFLTIGYFALIVAVGAGVFGLAALHYVVWGRWLTETLRRQAEEEED